MWANELPSFQVAEFPGLETRQPGNQATPHKLLMVEDEPAIVEGIGALLSIAGYDVSSAGTGEEAIEEIDALNPDIVLLDVGLPGIDGIETHRRLRALKPRLPIILASGHEARHTSDDGLTQYLQKPFAMTALFDAIAALEASL